MPSSAFISHSWSDKAVAHKLADRLRKHGVRVWLDDAEIKIGDSLIQKIRSGLDEVDYVIALLSPRACRSEWVSRELDIAMNQEIEGRRVKVLPVLARQCELPGFLKGKLYADISTSRKFEEVLPRLLDSLGVSLDIIQSLKSQKDYVRKSSDFAWVHDLERAVASGDEKRLFEILRSINTYDARPMLREHRTLKHILKAAEDGQPVHVRVRALEVLRELGEKSFWYYIEPFLDDKSDHVAVKAIEALAGLEATEAGERVLAKLNSTTTRPIVAACLRFFSGVPLESEADKLSLLSICRKIEGSAPVDPGLMLLTTQALASQVDGEADEIIDFIASRLAGGDAQIRIAALSSIWTHSGEFFGSPKSRHVLGNAIIECLKAPDHKVKAAALVAALLTKDILPQFRQGDLIWKTMYSSDQWALHQMFEYLMDYRLSFVFGRDGDCARLLKLIGRFGEDLDNVVERALTEVASVECIKILAERHVRIVGWFGRQVLQTMVAEASWPQEFSSVLSRMDAKSVVGEDAITGLMFNLAGSRLGISAWTTWWQRSHSEGITAGSTTWRERP